MTGHAERLHVHSLADFYADANGFLANPNRTTSPVTLRADSRSHGTTCRVRTTPIQALEVFYAGGYAQDDWRIGNNLKLNGGLRIDFPSSGIPASPIPSPTR